MLNWDTITKTMELRFTVAITPGVKKQTVLYQAIKWISNHLNPEDVFSEQNLLSWYREYDSRINDPIKEIHCYEKSENI